MALDSEGLQGGGIGGAVLPIADLITNIIVERSNPPPSTLPEKEADLYRHLKNLGYDVAISPEGHLIRHPRGLTQGPTNLRFGLSEFEHQADQPFQPPGLGGGVLAPGTYSGDTGRLAGALLRRKKVKVSHLVLGGVQSVLPSLVQGLFR